MATINWTDALAAAKQAKIAELDNMCSQTILGNFPYVVNGVTYYFPNNDTAQRNFDKFYLAFQNNIATSTENFTCYDVNGDVCRLSFDATTFPALYTAHLQHITSNISKFRDDLQPKVEEATTISAVNNITW